MKNSMTIIILIFCSLILFTNEIRAQYSTTGYTEISGNNVQIQGNDSNNKFIIKNGSSWKGSVTYSGSQTLYMIIEGTATFDWFSIGITKIEIILGATGQITDANQLNSHVPSNYTLTNYSGSLKLSSIRGHIINYGTINSSNSGNNPRLQIGTDGTAWLENYGIVDVGDFQIDHTVENHKTIMASGRLDVNTTATLENLSNSTITVGGDFKVDNIFTNSGTTTIAGKFDVNSSATFENRSGATLTVGRDIKVDKIFRNYGTTTVSGDLTTNSSSTMENSCRIDVSGDLTIRNIIIMRTSSYMKVYGKSTFEGNASKLFEEDAFLKTYDIQNWNSPVSGPNSGHALIQYFGDITGNKTNFINNLHLIDKNGKENGEDVNYIISKSTCNEGFGASKDKDSDGVPDNQDDFPDDPDRAFISYYPSDEGTWNTLMFEDLWPDKGDYDFNDLVIKYQYEFYSNADNQVVDLIAHFQVVASGASYANGFGFKLDIPNEAVLDVSGYVYAGTSITLNANKTEHGEDDNEAVVIVYDNLKASIGSMFNVVHGGATKSIAPIAVHVKLNKVDMTDVTVINPFIFVSQTRGREVHLMNYTPTSKVDPNYFNTGDDNSNGGKYYRSASGYPWGLDVPADVSHMIETIDFTIGYPNFIKWAQSGGKESEDWYSKDKYAPALY